MLIRFSIVDVFKFDASYIENEERYKSIKAEILGEGSSDEEESGSEESSEEEEEDEEGACVIVAIHIYLSNSFA